MRINNRLKTGLVFLTSFILALDLHAQNRVQHVMNKYKDSISNIGIVALVGKGAKIETGAIGVTGVGGAAKPGQLFGIGSLTKVFLATAVLKLYDQKKLGLDDPINKYLNTENKFIDTAITIRQLLNHTSGVKDYALPDFINTYLVHPEYVLTDKDILAQIDAVDYRRGERHEYSNSNYFLLRLIVERVTELPIELALDELILKPCHLSHTYPYLLKNLPQLAHPTQRGNDYFDVISFKTITDQSKGPGQMTSNLNDLYTFFDLLLVKKQILKPETLKQMLTFEPGDDDAYGLGIFRTEVSGKMLINHTGKQIGYQAFLYLDPKTDTIYVVQCNDMNDRYAYRILQDLVAAH